MNIIKDYIPPGRRNRPMTAPQSSLYNKKMVARYITIHNPAAPSWDAKRLHDYGKSQGTVGSLKSWHFSVDKDNAYQMLPLDESGWHAGDGLGAGNTTTIGFEICDRGAYARNMTLFWQDHEHAAEVCAHLVKTVSTLLPFPDCIVQHNKWSNKNCPSWIRAEAGGWQRFINLIKKHIDGADWPTHPIPSIQRTVGVEVNGQRTDEVAYLINNATYVRAAYLQNITDLEVTGHGNHIKIQGASK